MSKTTKNIVLVFTLLCSVVLVLFCVELVIINSGNESGSTLSNGDPANSGEAANGDGESPNGADSFFGDPNGTGPGSGQLDDPGLTDGLPLDLRVTRRNHLISGGAELVLYADEELFDFEEIDENRIYTYLGEGIASFEIHLALIQPQDGLDGLASRYLRNYSDDIEATVGDERNIGRTSISGLFVSGSHDGIEYEAWLRSMSDFGQDTIALVFVIYYEDQTQRDALFNVLDTMEIVILEDAEDDE